MAVAYTIRYYTEVLFSYWKSLPQVDDRFDAYGTYGYITGYAALDIPPRWRHVTDKAAVRSSGYRF